MSKLLLDRDWRFLNHDFGMQNPNFAKSGNFLKGPQGPNYDDSFWQKVDIRTIIPSTEYPPTQEYRTATFQIYLLCSQWTVCLPQTARLKAIRRGTESISA